MPRKTFSDVLTQVRLAKEKERPGFSLFLGAGASKASGIPLANDLADAALETLYCDAGNALPDDADVRRTAMSAWEKDQPWFDPDLSRYSLIMEKALLAPGIRETFLRSYTEKFRLSRGYRRLAQLLKAGIFDTVFTTNFDDLVRRAADAVLENAMAHVAALVQYPLQNPSPSHPRLIRLHGDYHHGDVLNTEGELERTPSIRYETVRRLASPQGMIVIGYGGWDRKLMADLFLRNIEDTHFVKNGLFWCVPPGAEISHFVRVLHDKGGGRVHIVEIESFDDAMETLADGFNLAPDASYLRDSLRGAVDIQALQADAAELVLHGNEEMDSLQNKIDEVFFSLCIQMEAKEGFLVATKEDVARIVSATNQSHLSSDRFPAKLLASLPDEPGIDITEQYLLKHPPLNAVVQKRRSIAYPLVRDGDMLGVGIFCFDPLSKPNEMDARTVAAITGLLVLAGGRFLSAEWRVLATLARASWEERGCPHGSPDVDWARAQAKLRKKGK